MNFWMTPCMLCIVFLMVNSVTRNWYVHVYLLHPALLPHSFHCLWKWGQRLHESLYGLNSFSQHLPNFAITIQQCITFTEIGIAQWVVLRMWVYRIWRLRYLKFKQAIIFFGFNKKKKLIYKSFIFNASMWQCTSLVKQTNMSPLNSWHLSTQKSLCLRCNPLINLHGYVIYLMFTPDSFWPSIWDQSMFFWFGINWFLRTNIIVDHVVATLVNPHPNPRPQPLNP